MSSITPPFDTIPRVPAKIISKLSGIINKEISKLNEQVQKTIKDSTKLPSNVKCDDPRVRRVKTQLTNVQAQIAEIQSSISQIQQIATTVKSIVQGAVAIKASISAVQLLNPVTAPVFIAQQLMAVQDTLIVNAVSSLNQFSTIPNSITSNLALIVPQLTEAINKLSQICNFDANDATNISEAEIKQLNISRDVLAKVKNLSNITNDPKFNVNSKLSTEFYNEDNVSDSDIDNRTEEIQIILDGINQSFFDQIELQAELRKSITEAPAVVYKQNAWPSKNIGKIGDYYIDTLSEPNKIYGPKLSATDWGTAIEVPTI